MTPAEAAELLTLAGAFDRRTIGKTDAIAWADALDGLNPADCAEAIRAHFRASTDYLMPVHVRTGVKAIRDERIRTANTADLDPHDIDPDDVHAWLKARRARVEAIADGRTPDPEPVGEITRPVAQLLESTAARMPSMPRAMPAADLAKKRAAPVTASSCPGPVDGTMVPSPVEV